MSLSHERYCAEVVAQTELARACIENADLTAPVPSCPEWNVGQLLRHLGGGQRWAARTVGSRATEPLSDEDFRDLSPYANEDFAVLGPWLAEGAEQLAGALRDAGPDMPVWTPTLDGTVSFYARRFTHETVIHRADATLALGAPFVLAEDVAVDGVDEWMYLFSLPKHLEYQPKMRELLGPGRTLSFQATDTAARVNAAWLLDLTGETIGWRRTSEPGAVTVQGPLTDLLLAIYQRRPARGEGLEMRGDEQLLDFWLERAGFG